MNLSIVRINLYKIAIKYDTQLPETIE